MVQQKTELNYLIYYNFSRKYFPTHFWFQPELQTSTFFVHPYENNQPLFSARRNSARFVRDSAVSNNIMQTILWHAFIADWIRLAWTLTLHTRPRDRLTISITQHCKNFLCIQLPVVLPEFAYWIKVSYYFSIFISLIQLLQEVHLS